MSKSTRSVRQSDLEDLEDLVIASGFRLLLAGAEPVTPPDLAAETGLPAEQVSQLMGQLERGGRLRRDAKGRLLAAAGLSLVPDRHEIELDGRRLWTWCAYDFLGIFAALGADGRALSPSPADGQAIEIRFVRGRPVQSRALLFRPDQELRDRCQNVYEEWCSNSNLFATRELAAGWARARGVPGRVLELEEASRLAGDNWRRLMAITAARK